MAQKLHVDEKWFLDFLNGCKQMLKKDPRNFILETRIERMEKFIRPYLFNEKDFSSLKIYKWIDRRDKGMSQTCYYINDEPIKGRRIRDRVYSNLFCPKDLPSYETPFSNYFIYFGIKHNEDGFAVVSKHNTNNIGEFSLFGAKSTKEQLDEHNLYKKLKRISEL